MSGRWPLQPGCLPRVFDLFDATGAQPVVSVDALTAVACQPVALGRRPMHRWVFRFVYGPKHQGLTSTLMVDPRTPDELLEVIEDRHLIGLPLAELGLPRLESGDYTPQAALMAVVLAFNPGLFLGYRAWILAHDRKLFIERGHDPRTWTPPWTILGIIPPDKLLKRLTIQEQVLGATVGGLHLCATYTPSDGELVLHGTAPVMEHKQP